MPKIEINTYVLHFWQNHILGQLLHGQYFVQTSDGSYTFSNLEKMIYRKVAHPKVYLFSVKKGETQDL